MPNLPLIDAVPEHAIALRDDATGDWLSYGDLARDSRQWSNRLSGPKSLIFLYARNDCETVAALLGAIAAGHAVALFDPKSPPASRVQLEQSYRPEWVIGPEPGELQHRPTAADTPPVHPDLAILLSTSGSTGSAKLVRLTLANIEANARAIATVLHMSGSDVAAGYLPLHYSYGLSVLTSHLSCGARVRLTAMGLTERDFWPAMRDAGVTHMPGVPFHHQVMLRLGLKRLGLSSLRTLTQAGGALDADLRQRAHDHMVEAGGAFFILYGQTEAAPRMTTLQHADFPAAPTSVGTALPGCRIEIVEPDANGHGEVLFRGPNVMMGYAESRADLSLGDEMRGELRTGDIGFLDSAGRLTLTGRVKRFGKLFGLRVNLDEIEQHARSVCDAAVTQDGERLTIHFLSSGDPAHDERLVQQLAGHFAQRLTIPPSGYDFRAVPSIPRTERGKVDYTMLGRIG